MCKFNNINFPSSLLDISINCYSFNSSLPCNLKSLKLVNYSHQELNLPSTLEHLSIFYMVTDNLTPSPRFQSLPINLKTLELEYCKSIINDQGASILPNKLEKLTLHSAFDSVIQANQLPSSLTFLDLGESFNQIIDVGVLPVNLVTLILGYSYTQVINPLAIPQQLKLLEILNEDYNHPIYLPISTHPYTTVSFENIDLYYDPSNTGICALRIPDYFSESLSTLQLEDKSKLEYLHLGIYFNQPIQLSDLQINNQIKTLEVNAKYNHTINLEHFQNLESIIINDYKKNTQLKITTTTTNNNNNNTIKYNNYKLQNIIVSPKQHQFIKQLDYNFYQFIKLKKDI